MSQYFIPNHPCNLASYLLDHNVSNPQRATRDALHCKEGTWSYQEIAIQANRFAHLLVMQGIQVEDRVLLVVDDSADFVAAWLGILKAGAVVVMINPSLDVDRLNELVHYSRARCAIIQERDREHWSQVIQTQHSSFHLQSVICVLGGERTEKSNESGILEVMNGYAYHSVISNHTVADQRPIFLSFESFVSDLPTQHICYPSHGDDPAVWLFSGGTTGSPKAIIQPHKSFIYTTERYAKACIQYQETDRVLSIPKLYFGYATGANLIFPFSVGASSILFHEKPSVDLLFKIIDQYQPSIMINVPTIINRMIKHPQAQEQDLSMLRFVTSAGEALPVALHELWDEYFKVPLYDGLGTAEMWHIFLTNHAQAHRKGSLGKVVDGFEIYLKDAEGKDVDVGEAGVMWVKGGARALRYWQQQTESEHVFYGDYYRSADLLKQDVDGFYYYCGRQDDMVKVAGKWVAAKEVEDCLMKHLLVKECAVVANEDETGLIKIFAHVILHTIENQDLDPSLELMNHLKKYLDSYKLPKTIRIHKEFKRTHLGKIDRKALKKSMRTFI